VLISDIMIAESESDSWSELLNSRNATDLLASVELKEAGGM
jgi:hypothetical protein